jgi:hypothetical protein
MKYLPPIHFQQRGRRFRVRHDRLMELVRKHGLTATDLGWVCGAGEKAAHRWLRGEVGAPGALYVLLLALDEGRIDIAWLAKKAHSMRPVEDIIGN